ncbi:MAG: alpha/beta hydrolase [Actinobacteria bacterium]|nr:alpha/beta hydrolase [Actinomycetota bacterium]
MTERTDGGIAYDDIGRGEPALLLLPGWCAPRRVFGPLMPRLGDKRRVLALDWRGHGESASAAGDFGFEDLVDDAVAVIAASGAESVVPVGLSHAGWVVIELRRRLGADAVPGLVLLSWMVLGAPPPFVQAIEGMANPATTRAVVNDIMPMWANGVDLVELQTFLDDMAATPDEMWARGAREISAQFAREGRPVDAIAQLNPVPPTLHLYALPPDDAVLEAQQAFAAGAGWFEVHRLDAKTHFPMFEVPDQIATLVEEFAGGLER